MTRRKIDGINESGNMREIEIKIKKRQELKNRKTTPKNLIRKINAMIKTRNRLDDRTQDVEDILVKRYGYEDFEAAQIARDYLA